MKTTLQTIAKFIRNTLLVSTVLSGTAIASQMTIALDVSGSNPLLVNQTFNVGAAGYVWKQMKGIKNKDVVTVKFIGSLNDTHNFRKNEHVITKHNTKTIKNLVKQIILSSPTFIKAQSSTNLLAFFGRNQFDCQRGGKIIVLTDAIEASEYVDAKALLSGKASLPKPNEFVQLKGCDVQFYGVGVGRSDKEFLILRRQWQAYFKSAGATFTAVAP